MKKVTFFVLGFLLSSSASLADEKPCYATVGTNFIELEGKCPLDIGKFIEKYNDCLHFSGEAGSGNYESDKANEEIMTKLQCDRMDKTFKKLSSKYKKSNSLKEVWAKISKDYKSSYGRE